LVGPNFVIQQDGDSKYTFRLLKNYLERKEEDGVSWVMSGPPLSPDLDTIEPVWDEHDGRLSLKFPTSGTPAVNWSSNISSHHSPGLMCFLCVVCRSVIFRNTTLFSYSSQSILST